METPRNWTAVGIGLEVLAGVTVTIEPLLSIPVALGGAAAIAWGLYPEQIKRRTSMLFFRKADQSEFINLPDAVIDAWERIRNLPQFDEPPPNQPQFDSYREYHEADPMKMSGRIAQVIFNAADPPIPIEGISPPRTVMEVIPVDKAAEYGFSDDATELFDWFDEDKPSEQRKRYINLQVKRADIERRIKDMGG